MSTSNGELNAVGKDRGGQIRKLAIVAVLAVIVTAFFVFDLGQYFTLSYIKHSQAQFTAYYNEHAILVIGAYMLIYVIMAALSLPGAAVLTLLGGALFGVLAGTIAVSFASTIGATLACIVARFLLRDWVQGKIGDRLKSINKGVEKDGAFYLFTMRLIPAFPFWLINLAMGLTNMPVLTFYWVSQIGMLPGTLVYINAGKELGKLDSLSGILSPTLIFSFALLGIFPLAVKKLMGLVRKEERHHGEI